MSESGKEIHNDVLRDSMNVENNSLDIIHVLVVLESSSVHTDVFAKLCNFFLVIVSKLVHGENSFGYLRRINEVDLEKLCLEVSFVHTVGFKSRNKECSAVLDLTVLKEDVDDLLDVSLGWTRVS